MRLSKIKLAGFKSFVDPAVLPLPGNLIGVVGPNGCGKSNLIDAVRWVMGESSARSLRGETMSDVIFNGAAGRKPVGQASVELVFDNDRGRLGGPWASYAEIAIKRLVGRDGQSSYFLNGARCRRRDIADIFLGTGLGPRSYAIIEQGMISRVIEAKPEELRVFLEEAAGVAKYKERRRETETRIRHARDNLERLRDLREELGRQLQHLQRQARAAAQYRDSRAEERRLKAELLSLRWRDLRAELQAQEQNRLREETALDAIMAEQRQAETRLETGRLRRIELSDAHNDAQGRYYQTGARISRLEQYLQHQHDLRRRREEERRQTAAALEQLEGQLSQDRGQQQAWLEALAAAEPELAAARIAEAAADAALTAAEETLRGERAAWDEFSQRAGERQRQIEVERTRIEHLQQRLLQGEQRLERLRQQREQWGAEAADRERTDLESLEPALAETVQREQEQLLMLEREATETRDALRRADLQIRLARERLEAGRGRLSSLQTLQEAALGRDEDDCNDWLRAQGLDRAPRLAEQLEVEPGWEDAVETVLADWLDAVCVDELDPPARALAELGSGRLTLLEPTAVSPGEPSSGLAAKVASSYPLTDLLAGVAIAADWNEALARRAGLAANESLITPQGGWCGRRWLRLRQAEDDGGVLRREREIRRLEAELREAEAELSEQSAQAEQLRARLHEDLEQQQRDARRRLGERQREHGHAQGQLQALRERWRQAREQQSRIAEEQAELEIQHRDDQEQLQLARWRLDETLADQKTLHSQQADLAENRERAGEALRQSRARAEAARREAAGHTTAVETLRARLEAVRQALERLDAQRQQLRLRAGCLDQEGGGDADGALAAAEDDLARHLDGQLELENELARTRQALEAHEAELTAQEQLRAGCERRAEGQRRTIEDRRIASSETRVRQQNLTEQLRELDAEPETVLGGLRPEASEPACLEQLAQVERRLQRLGPINLAAIEECAQVTERKSYLDAQNDDLTTALAALENAIRQIDRETRARFQDTFERVNSGLGELFPRLFGGGQAQLVLSDENVLEAGVTVMAKPPGKRVGSIGLLSGGEKALTAIALVFAIFQLNPAPFCLLDEVDAPLDEANVGRFGALVQELSEQVQFIFVTHNKATMEIARHLAGVTMQEPGVSRLVAVDVEAAARLVEASYGA